MITEEEFMENICQFVQISTYIKDGWFLDTFKNKTFARKKSIVSLPQQGAATRNDDSVSGVTAASNGISKRPDAIIYAPTTCLSNSNLEEKDFCEEDSFCMSSNVTSPQTIRYEYHVLYSESYAVPVLYLNVLNSAGRRLSLDEVWGLCPDTFQPYLSDNKWTTLTQQEHPLLGIPFLMLHPCHTADFMAQVNKGLTADVKHKRNYLVAWLSAVGPLVGLTISQQYAISLNSLKGAS